MNGDRKAVVSKELEACVLAIDRETHQFCFKVELIIENWSIKRDGRFLQQRYIG